MRAVTFVATAASESSHWVVLVNEWSGFIGVASHTLTLKWTLANLFTLRRVYGVAVATDNLTFRYGVMKVQSELSKLSLVTLTA